MAKDRKIFTDQEKMEETLVDQFKFCELFFVWLQYSKTKGELLARK